MMLKQPRRAFPYFGSKARLAKHYPEPKHDLIVEPFAGAAAYSQRHWQKQVVLTDLNPRVVLAWSFLIRATPADVLALPDVAYRDDIDTWQQLDPDARELIRFYSYDGFAHGFKGVGKRCIWNRSKQPLADIVHHFSHWQIYQMSYAKLLPGPATWFIDPPYEFGGEHYDYPNTDIDFTALRGFCESRKGQVIVCENTKATWAPFVPLVEHRGIKHTTTEAVLLMENT